jgi:hypothetical protein
MQRGIMSLGEERRSARKYVTLRQKRETYDREDEEWISFLFKKEVTSFNA